MNNSIKSYLNSTTQATTLAFFRLAFGLLMFGSILRFLSYGWVDKLYIQPQFNFSYYGFEWIKPVGNYTYLIYIVCAFAAFFVAIGFKYKWAIITFFLSFTYIELMDKTTYLNHYYFISVVAFILIFLPANATYSVDVYQRKRFNQLEIPQWNVDILKIILGIVYFYAGLAKLNSDWLVKAMPLKIWLPNQSNIPLIGNLLHENWVHFAFSWSGAIYDLAIPFLLLFKRTRVFAFVLVVIFHIMTKILFPIGVFPYVMIISTLIFFGSDFHKKVLDYICRIFRINASIFQLDMNIGTQINNTVYKSKLVFLALFLAFQIIFPFRYLLYPNELFWTEEGYRFSWRVMLMEKAGYTQFYITDAITKEKKLVNNRNFLSTFQEKQMATQPDFILEYAHYLHDYYKKTGVNEPIVTVQSYVALNGRLSQMYVDPTVDLAKIEESFQHKNWLLPFNDEIKGF